MKASFYKKTFEFKRPSGTSRGILTHKKSWFIEIWNEENPTIKGLGECSIIDSLSPEFEDDDHYQNMLSKVCNNLQTNLDRWPSIKFGVETALLDLKNGGKGDYFINDFTTGNLAIPINGLIWMGEPSFMRNQIESKIKEGFSTIKLKIGAINFQEELAILKEIRRNYSIDEITLRVDANGAFDFEESLDKLKALSEIGIHSIEQPIKAGQLNRMALLCENTPLPIALDEELIGINSYEDKTSLLKTINPQYIILKPSLHGGISGSREWIEIANELNIQWWITSALESNIGLNAICQFTAEYKNDLPQGLGTGLLYQNNIESDLIVEHGLIRKNVI